MSTSINWTELIKDRKGVVTKDNQSCGNIIGDDEENIIIEDGAISQHFYRIPKSAVGGYNGAELTLNMQYNELATHEDKGSSGTIEPEQDQGSEKGTLESITDSIKNTVKSVKEKTVDKAVDATTQDESKSEISDRGHADNVQYERIEGITGKNQKEEINRNIDTGKQSDETSTNVESSFTCETCDTKFTSRQELKEHSAIEH